MFGRGVHFFIGAMVHTDPVFKNPTKMTHGSYHISIPNLKLIRARNIFGEGGSKGGGMT